MLDRALGTSETVWGTRYAEMSLFMQKQIYQFCAAKSIAEMRSLANLAAGKQGTMRTFDEFKAMAERKHSLYNNTYLKTETDTVRMAAGTAMLWQDYLEHEDISPNLRYETMEDERVRSSHRVLNGIVRPIHDPFWNTYYPPNGYNCRCTTVQTDERQTRLAVDKPLPIPKIFEHNLAKENKMFPPEHPYFEKANAFGKINETVAALPQEQCFIDVQIPEAERTVQVHALFGDSELAKNMEIAVWALQNGYKDVRLLPELGGDIPQNIRDSFYPKGQRPAAGKNADAIIDGNVYEMKTCAAKQFGTRVRQAMRQSKNIVIKTDATGWTKENTLRSLENNHISGYEKLIVILKDGTSFELP